MSAFGRLWKRAPLWRTCFIIGVGGLAMAAFYPTPLIKQYAPWVPGTPSTPSKASSATQPSPQGEHHSIGHLSYPDINSTISDHIALAGHYLPLPAGEWHPILSAQTTNDTPFSFIALMRTDHGAVTGFITAQATQEPIPLILAENLLTQCHDDRNYLTRNHETPGSADCAFLSNALLGNGSISLNPFISEAISRVHILGFPLPPLMIVAGWRHIMTTGNDQGHAVAEDVLLAPLDPDTHQLLAPLPAWNKETLPHFPEAQHFLERARHWLPLWQAALQKGFNNSLQPNSLPVEATRDPASP